MYYIGICDDEPIFLQQVTALTQEILTGEGISFHIRTFRNTQMLEEYLQYPGNTLNLLLLDIIMEERSGIEYARQLRKQANEMPIVFITSTMDYALEGYKVDSTGYILKPVNREELRETLLRAYKKHQRQTVVLTSASHSISFQLDDILYLEVHDKELTIHTADGTVRNISMPLNSLISKLPSEQFVQCYRSYIVSLPAIISIWRYGIELKNHEKIPVSRNYYSTVQNALMNWAMR